MAPNNRWKFGRAYKAMKALGYSTETVKPILKNLLDAYDKNWDHIEDNNYAVLVEAILDDDDRKKDDQLLTSWLEDDSEENDDRPLKRSRHGSSNSSPAHIYPDSKQSETTAGFLYTQKDNHNRSYTTQGNDENAMQVLPPQRMCKGREKRESFPKPSPIMEKLECIEVLSDNENDENDQNDSVSFQKPCLISTEGTSPLFLAMTKRRLTYESTPASLLENPNVVCSSDVSSNTNAPDKFISGAVIPVNEPFPDDQPGEFLYSETSTTEEKCLELSEPILLGMAEKDGSSNGIRGHFLEFPGSEDLYIEGKQNGPSDSPQLDIASTLKGEVKISLIYKPSSQSDFCAPSLDTVVQRVEEDCVKLYRITQPGFSLLKLMEDVCEDFLAAGTISNGKTRSLQQSTTIFPVKHNQEAIRFGCADHQPMFCIASEYFNGTVVIRNLIKVQPQIPMIPRSNMLETICIMRNINCKRSQGAEEHSKRKSPEILGSSTTSSGSMVVWEPQSSRKPFYYVEDITKGEEELKISLVNEFSNERPPPFMYIPTNTVFRDARIKFLLARISDDNCCSCCVGDCLSQKIPCACAGETCGEFVYTTECLVKEKFLESCISMNSEPQKHHQFYCQDCPLERSSDKNLPAKCKGHLVRNFIKECWHKCGCSKKCGNRVVQRGITVKLQVFMTPDGKGWGVRTLEDLPKGAFVCEYVGEIVTNTELFERNMHSANEKHTYPVLLDADWSSERVLKDEEALCLDATHYGNVARFINHRCFDANLVEIPVEIETPDHHYYHIAFFTTRNVNALEELTWDYGIDFGDRSHPVKAFKCHCGSKLCRNVKRKKRRNFVEEEVDLDDSLVHVNRAQMKAAAIASV
ncbi:probable inactive histone-lysine N-methyltransferase SUVR2 [Ipomoea triloba]|uniref:probable inactive histone-lysine N-methyltransferase SUVR2 n=1 Tax=Ipomoea triloba TaxID=35885 RepID=UPI00125E4671|nr:probable inactive histone-lysine N-methyltransferase SUVR2 [Ipomoea triloba]